jgi:tight adherence protein B
MRSSSSIIAEKIETKNEIQTLLTEKKLESKLVLVMPIATITIFTMTSQDYMSVLYTTTSGRIVMTITIGLLALSFLIGEKIMNVEV